MKKAEFDLIADKNAVAVNCIVSDGVVRPTLCPAYLGSVPENIIFAAHAEGAGKFFICTPASVYSSEDGQNFNLLCTFSSDKPFLLEDMDGDMRRAMIVSGANAVICNASGVAQVKPFGAKLSCAAVHSGRIFGADADDSLKLRWSDGSGADGWVEGLYAAGYLNLDASYGGVLDVINFGANLLLVREYGLTLLTAGGAPETFSVKFCDLPSDRIYKNTAAVAGEKLFFFTVSGLHCFDGSKISKVKHRFTHDISAPVRAAAHGGRYFLSCHSLSQGSIVFCYDTAEEEGFVLNISADAMCAAGGVYFYNAEGAYKAEEGGRFFFTAQADFGTGKRKTVTEIFIDCESADVEISNGKVARSFTGVSGNIRPCLRGEKFTVKVAAANPVKKLTATAEVTVGI